MPASTSKQCLHENNLLSAKAYTPVTFSPKSGRASPAREYMRTLNTNVFIMKVVVVLFHLESNRSNTDGTIGYFGQTN